MILAALLALAQASPVVPLPPTDWSSLPPLRYVRPAPPDADLSAFVRSEVAAGHCPRAVAAPGGWTLTVEIAVQTNAQDQVRRVVPRAMDCPAVEQYAAGIVSSMARGNIYTGDAQDGWYRTSLTFTWRA